MRKAQMIVSIQQLRSKLRRLLKVLHGRLELSQSQLAVAPLQIKLSIVRCKPQPTRSSCNSLTILPPCSLRVSKLNHQADIFGIGRQALASIFNGFVTGQRIELAAQAGGELKGARRCCLRRKICRLAKSRDEQ